MGSGASWKTKRKKGEKWSNFSQIHFWCTFSRASTTLFVSILLLFSLIFLIFLLFSSFFVSFSRLRVRLRLCGQVGNFQHRYRPTLEYRHTHTDVIFEAHIYIVENPLIGSLALFIYFFLPSPVRTCVRVRLRSGRGCLRIEPIIHPAIKYYLISSYGLKVGEKNKRKQNFEDT